MTVGRIVNVSSSLGSLTLQNDPQWPSYHHVVPAYQALKTALNALTVAFATLLSDTTITVTSVCPPGEFVARIAWDTDRVTGEFLDRDGPLPW